MVRQFVLLLVGGLGVCLGSCHADAPVDSSLPTVDAAATIDSADAVQKASVAAVGKPAAEPLQVLRRPHGITLRLGRAETYDLATPLTLYRYLQVEQAGKLVYEDSTREYEVSPRPYPTTFADASGSTAVLLEVNNRDANLLLRLRVKDGHAAITDTLPAFLAAPQQLDADAPLEVAGPLSTNERWGEHAEYTGYNPILYYELMPSGPVLDRKLTKTKAQAIYGQFLGLRYREKPPVPATALEAYAAELQRITTGAKRR